MDGTFVLIHVHIDNVDYDVKFTMEPEQHSRLPFPELCMHVQDDAATKLATYWLIPQLPITLPPVVQEVGYENTDKQGKQYVATAEDKKAELAHVYEALRANNYSEWAFDIPPPCSIIEISQDSWQPTPSETVRTTEQDPVYICAVSLPTPSAQS